MAVILLDDWNGFTVGTPSASCDISAGSDRLMWMVYLVEDTSITYNSMTVGGVSATGQQLTPSTSAAEQLYIWSWFWDEAAIAAMTSSTIVLSQGGVTVKSVWDWIVFQDAPGGAEFATAVEDSANNTSISLAGNSSINDQIAVAIQRSAQNRDVTAYDNLTEGWQRNTDMTSCVADGAGGDDDIALTGDGFSGDWLVQALHIKDATAALSITMKNLHEAMLNG